MSVLEDGKYTEVLMFAGPSKLDRCSFISEECPKCGGTRVVWDSVTRTFECFECGGISEVNDFCKTNCGDEEAN